MDVLAVNDIEYLVYLFCGVVIMNVCVVVEFPNAKLNVVA